MQVEGRAHLGPPRSKLDSLPLTVVELMSMMFKLHTSVKALECVRFTQIAFVIDANQDPNCTKDKPRCFSIPRPTAVPWSRAALYVFIKEKSTP